MKADSFKAFVLGQLKDIGELDCRAMFGGYGIYSEEIFFGIIYEGKLFFKTSEETRQAYLAKGMKPFQPTATQILRDYYEVPVNIIEDCTMLAELAEESIEVAS